MAVVRRWVEKSIKTIRKVNWHGILRSRLENRKILFLGLFKLVKYVAVLENLYFYENSKRPKDKGQFLTDVLR